MSFRGGLLDPRPNFQVVGIQWKSASEILVQDHPEGALLLLLILLLVFLIPFILVLGSIFLPLSSTKRYPSTDDGGSAPDDFPGNFGSFLGVTSIFTIFIPFLAEII